MELEGNDAEEWLILKYGGMKIEDW